MLTANTHEELLDRLLLVDATVPRRSEGRRSHHTENYAIVHLLGTLPADRLPFPLELSKSERPDFVLRCNGLSIGIEHTEAISENAAKESFLRSSGIGPNCYFVQRAHIGEPRKSSKQIEADILTNEPGEPWIGDSMEKEWVEAMLFFVSNKLSSANKNGFQRHDKTWLAIYDNWPAVGLHQETALPLLSTELSRVTPWTTFDRIFILSESHLIELYTSDSGIQHHLHDRRRLHRRENEEPTNFDHE
jgi:hypothetical protein